MRNTNTSSTRPTHTRSTVRLAVAACSSLLLASACTGSDAEDATVETTPSSDAVDPPDDTAPATSEEPAAVDTSVESAPAESVTSTEAASETTESPAVEGSTDCADVAALFTTRGSANPDLDDPEVSATCEGDSIVITSNGIPDYTYIETSPGQPRDQDNTFTIPATPTMADEVTDVPIVGTAAVSLGGIQIFGPTEGTGGDVESLPGILSDCGSHNGPSGFHIHLILTSSDTDCLFTPDEVAAEPQLVGYAFDGFPIYTGADQYTSSWQLTDESLFATDTWAAHTYVEGSGDLDECNGLTDADGNYAYYTTDTFPYVLGCYAGVVDLDAGGGGGGTGGGGDDGGERPERPDGEEGAEGRGEPPEADEDRPERPDEAGEPPEGGDEG